LQQIARTGFFDTLAAKTATLVNGLKAMAKQSGVAFSADCEGGMFGFFLLADLPQNYSQVMKSDSQRFNVLFHGLLDRGVYIAPALYEAGFVSAAHTDADIEQTIAAAREVFRAM
jgi:glutamate-1-semialdehyde 2,1-aminomutase